MSSRGDDRLSVGVRARVERGHVDELTTSLATTEVPDRLDAEGESMAEVSQWMIRTGEPAMNAAMSSTASW